MQSFAGTRLTTCRILCCATQGGESTCCVCGKQGMNSIQAGLVVYCAQLWQHGSQVSDLISEVKTAGQSKKRLRSSVFRNSISCLLYYFTLQRDSLLDYFSPLVLVCDQVNQKCKIWSDLRLGLCASSQIKCDMVFQRPNNVKFLIKEIKSISCAKPLISSHYLQCEDTRLIKIEQEAWQQYAM